MPASKLRALARWKRGCDGLRCMATMNKEASISLRMTKPERRELEQTAALLGEAVNPLAASYVREGVRQRDDAVATAPRRSGDHHPPRRDKRAGRERDRL